MADDRRFETPASLTPLIRQVAPGHHRGGRGIHGVVHWARVLENGLRIGAAVGANLTVVRLFAVFHDCRRRNDHHDPGHGARGGQVARDLRAEWLDVNDEELELLVYACDHHTDGLTEADPTVQACWDADRLDLPRCGIRVRPDRLCTDTARGLATIAWAEERAVSDYRPDFVADWLIR
jgi:uncharacterized protein